MSKIKVSSLFVLFCSKCQIVCFLNFQIQILTQVSHTKSGCEKLQADLSGRSRMVWRSLDLSPPPSDHHRHLHHLIMGLTPSHPRTPIYQFIYLSCTTVHLPPASDCIVKWLRFILCGGLENFPMLYSSVYKIQCRLLPPPPVYTTGMHELGSVQLGINEVTGAQKALLESLEKLNWVE